MPNSVEGDIALIGLGYVGLPLAVEFGKKRRVLGFDINAARVEELRNGIDRTLEVEREELASARHLTFTNDAADLANCQVFIVTVPTPIDDANRPDLTPLVKASEMIGAVMRRGATVIYESTVYPGATEEVCVPALARASGLVFNRDFFCGYSPERINPADKQHKLPTIVKVTSGSTPEVADQVDALYASIITAGTHKASSIKVAEASKVIENTQRDLNIALMNELSVVFARVGIDTAEVLKASCTKWNFLNFRPGLVGGHCIGVDPYYLTHKAEQLGYIPQVVLAGRRINDNMGRYVARNTVKLMLKNGIDVPRSRIGVMGITFKENCPDTRNSKVVDLARELAEHGAEIVVEDPLADPDEVSHEYGIKLSKVSSEHPVDALVIAVGHDSYRSLTTDEIKSRLRGSAPVVADVKSLFDRHALAARGITVFRL
ncbi:UDP-glucose/GDP-mannose dehydrogenase family protein; putative Capsular polysaccharide biosynthesis protein [Hyphomicrobium sp. GJ21]|uniref:nucleotide sugar dehydrogenase n=1 Tax=Hyphomicrobium sp. GJ21 TaxID=113574 RepID=UPI000622C02B|nr:nucleotide sugar dehydrogenase [Hyphomicrobium sp. GJ21]CEJ87281.1 UDP-glucose/GDP-mannose dehydrogenase family protein; putative Capsular polysaccharide biosynthesis protein [Hyphomicrobium sp. GJ21]